MLVHGAGATMGLNWSYLSPLLKERGYCVELDAFVDPVLATTGAAKVDLVGHSEGTYMPQYWLKFLGGAPKVKRYVAYTPLYDGTDLYGIANLQSSLAPLVSELCGSCPQFLAGSRMQRQWLPPW